MLKITFCDEDKVTPWHVIDLDNDRAVVGMYATHKGAQIHVDTSGVTCPDQEANRAHWNRVINT